MAVLGFRFFAVFAFAALVLSAGFAQPAQALDAWVGVYFDSYYPYYYGSYYAYGTYSWGYYPAYYSFLWPSYYTLYWDYPLYSWDPYYSYYPYASYYDYYPPQQAQYNFNYDMQPACGDNICSPGEDNYACPNDCRQASTCYDGTPYGQCSSQQPKQCQNGVLADNAQACGCPAGYVPQGAQCYQANPSCIVSVNPQTVRAGDRADVSLQYSQRGGNGMPFARVDCGNGQIVVAQCNGNSQAGTCATAACGFDSQPYVPRYQQVKATIDGQACSDASVRVVAQQPTTGSVLARITDCETNKPIGGAWFQATSASANASIPARGVYSNQGGIAQLPELQPAVYSFQVNANGYQTGYVSQQAFAGVANPVATCLSKTQCDIGLSIAGQNGNSFDVIVQNSAHSTNRTVILNYSSAFPIAGPGTVVLQGGQSQIINVNANVPADFAGKSAALVTAQGAACTSQLQLALDASRGLYVEARNASRGTLPGKRECFDVLARNKGADKGTVTMTSNGPYANAFFDAPQFQLSPYESRVVHYCVNVDDSFSGYAVQQIRATSPMGGSIASVTLQTPQATDFAVGNFNASECQPINFEQLQWNKGVQLQNNAFDGAFDVSVLKPDNLKVTLSPSKLYAFQKGNARSLYLQFDNSELPQAGTYYVALALSQNGLTAWQSQLCFTAGTVDSASLRLNQPVLQVQRGTGKLATAVLRNTGNYKRTFAINTNSSFQSVSFTPAMATLEPGAETTAEIFVQPSQSTSAGQYQVLVNLEAVGNNRTLAAVARLVVDVAAEQASGNGSSAAVVGAGGSGSGISGFFTLGSSEGALLVLLALMAVAGGYAYHRARENRKQFEQLKGKKQGEVGARESSEE